MSQTSWPNLPAESSLQALPFKCASRIAFMPDDCTEPHSDFEKPKPGNNGMQTLPAACLY